MGSDSSSSTCKLRNIGGAIYRLRRARDLAVSGYLRHSDAAALVAQERQRIPEIRQTLAKVEAAGQNAEHDDFALYEGQFEAIEVEVGGTMEALPTGTRDAVQVVFGAIAASLPPNVALELIETILARLSQDGAAPTAKPAQ